MLAPRVERRPANDVLLSGDKLLLKMGPVGLEVRNTRPEELFPKGVVREEKSKSLGERLLVTGWGWLEKKLPKTLAEHRSIGLVGRNEVMMMGEGSSEPKVDPVAELVQEKGGA